MSTFDKYFTEAEERQLFNAVKRIKGNLAERDYCWMRIARLTGMRLKPLSKLTIGDAINAIDSDYLSIGEFNKNQTNQSIFVVKECKKCLKKLIKIQRDMVKQSEVPEFERPLMVNRLGTEMNKRSYQRRFSMWVEVSGLKHGTVHWLRHTFAKRVIARNGDSSQALVACQKLLGHSNIKTTTIYTSPDKESVKEMMINAS